MQDQGMRLAEIKARIQQVLVIRETKAPYNSSRTTIELTPECRLELNNGQSLEAKLAAAQEAIRRILENLPELEHNDAAP